MKLLEYLDIDTSSDTVAVIMNAVSNKYGRKDVVKIENVTDIDLRIRSYRSKGHGKLHRRSCYKSKDQSYCTRKSR